MWIFYFWAQGLADDAHRDGKRQLLGRADDPPVGEGKQLVPFDRIQGDMCICATGLYNNSNNNNSNTPLTGEALSRQGCLFGCNGGALSPSRSAALKPFAS